MSPLACGIQFIEPCNCCLDKASRRFLVSTSIRTERVSVIARVQLYTHLTLHDILEAFQREGWNVDVLYGRS